MPRRTTLPIWRIDTTGPSGPHSAEELMAMNETLRPWSEMLTLATEARACLDGTLRRYIEMRNIAYETCRPGAYTTWIEGTIQDICMLLEGADSVIRAQDGYILRKLDPGITSGPAMAPGTDGDNAQEYPNFTERMKTVTERAKR